MFEGKLAGSDRNTLSGRIYRFRGHYLGDGLIMWRALIETEDGEFCGEVSGDIRRDGESPQEVDRMLHEMVEKSIREGMGYRAL